MANYIISQDNFFIIGREFVKKATKQEISYEDKTIYEMIIIVSWYYIKNNPYTTLKIDKAIRNSYTEDVGVVIGTYTNKELFDQEYKALHEFLQSPQYKDAPRYIYYAPLDEPIEGEE